MKIIIYIALSFLIGAIFTGYKEKEWAHDPSNRKEVCEWAQAEYIVEFGGGDEWCRWSNQ